MIAGMEGIRARSQKANVRAVLIRVVSITAFTHHAEDEVHTTPERGIPPEELAVEDLRELAAEARIHFIPRPQVP
jgi:hypothetical protein